MWAAAAGREGGRPDRPLQRAPRPPAAASPAHLAPPSPKASKTQGRDGPHRSRPLRRGPLARSTGGTRASRRRRRCPCTVSTGSCLVRSAGGGWGTARRWWGKGDGWREGEGGRESDAGEGVREGRAAGRETSDGPSWQTSERRCERTSDSQKRQEVTAPVVVQRRAVRATGTRADGRGGPGRGRRGRSAGAGRPGGDGAWSADVASGEEGTADKEGGGEGKITRAWSAPELSAGSSPKTARQHDAPGTCPRERRIAKLISLQVQGSTRDGRRKRRTSRRLNFAGRSVARVGMCRSPRIRTSMAAVRDADDGGRGRRGGRGGLRRGGPGEGSVSERSELLKTLC